MEIVEWGLMTVEDKDSRPWKIQNGNYFKEGESSHRTLKPI